MLLNPKANGVPGCAAAAANVCRLTPRSPVPLTALHRSRSYCPTLLVRSLILKKAFGRASARITKNRRFSATRIFQNHKPSTRITRGVTFLSHKVLFRSLNPVHLWFNHRFSSYVTAAIEHDLDGRRGALIAHGQGIGWGQFRSGWHLPQSWTGKATVRWQTPQNIPLLM